MRIILLVTLCTALQLVASGAANAAVVTKTPTNSGGIHIEADNGNGQFTEFYASGNDDEFAEYGILGFTYLPSDFGLTTLTEADVLSVQLSVTVNDRSFSDGDSIELFFTPDTFTSLGSGNNYSNLTFAAGLVNGIDASQFNVAPISLGVYSVPEMANRPGGEIDVIDVEFTGAALTGLVDSINAGSDFQLIAAATDASHDITYSGVGNTFDPGDPQLSITAVPEPSGLLLLGLMGSAYAARRRR